MKTISTYFAGFLILLFTLISSEALAQEQLDGRQSVLHELVVKKIGDEWRVVYKNDETKSTVRAKRNDRIRWTAEGSDISIQFDNRLFGGNPVQVPNTETRTRPVAPGAAAGEYIYAVFVHSDMVFARGESPPRIIIDVL